ncbi:MAG: helix-turn-helix domain-containing protein, partial [Clostridia bacterium]|nr:helix-turn-helix domain-containing protein [Clostridia bacterium]
MTTGERIRLLRMEKGLSQEGLADALDVTRQAVSRWETDGSLPDIDKLIGLCDLFGVSLDYLVRGKTPACEAAQNKAEAPDTATPHYSIPISRTAIAGILCIVLGVSAAPLLVFAFTPFYRFRSVLLPLIPITLLVIGLFLLLKRKPSVFWLSWGLLLTVTMRYTLFNRNLSDMIRGLLARYPALMFHNWEEIQKQMLVWLWIGLLIIGMLCWTVLRYRKIGLVH